MLGEVPISVTMPPSREANAMGISSADGERFPRRANWNAVGMRMASAPTFLQAMDSTPVANTRIGTCACTDFSRGSSGCIMDSITPERAMAVLITRAAPMMMTTSSEKPSKAWLMGTNPVSTATSSESTAIKS